MMLGARALPAFLTLIIFTASTVGGIWSFERKLFWIVKPHRLALEIAAEHNSKILDGPLWIVVLCCTSRQKLLSGSQADQDQ